MHFSGTLLDSCLLFNTYSVFGSFSVTLLISPVVGLEWFILSYVCDETVKLIKTLICFLATMLHFQSEYKTSLSHGDKGVVFLAKCVNTIDLEVTG